MVERGAGIFAVEPAVMGWLGMLGLNLVMGALVSGASFAVWTFTSELQYKVIVTGVLAMTWVLTFVASKVISRLHQASGTMLTIDRLRGVIVLERAKRELRIEDVESVWRVKRIALCQFREDPLLLEQVCARMGEQRGRFEVLLWNVHFVGGSKKAMQRLGEAIGKEVREPARLIKPRLVFHRGDRIRFEELMFAKDEFEDAVRPDPPMWRPSIARRM